MGEGATKDWNIARTGISLLLNNKTEEAEALFTGHPHSFHIKAGRCFVLFMNALMTFEDDKLQQAMLLLKDMERECAGDIGWLKSVKSKVFRAEETDKDYVNKLERQIVLADSQVCSAILTLLQQELTGYMRGGWMLRKAWRVYQHAYTQISQLYRRTFGTNPTGISPCCGTPMSNGSSMQSPQSPGSSEWSIPSCNGYANNVTPISSPSGLRSSLSMFFSLTGITSEQQTPSKKAIKAACTSQLRGAHRGDAPDVSCEFRLRYIPVVREPLTTIVAETDPFLGLRGRQAGWSHRADVRATQRGYARTARHSNVDAALEAYGKAVEASTQREIKLLCLHEVAWCHLIRLSYEEAYRSLLQLQHQSRWSKSFYAYLAMVCCGANGKFDILLTTYNKILHWFNEMNRETQLGAFILRRVPKLIDKDTGRPYTVLYYRLLVYELLYLWNAMPSCSAETLHGILLECTGNRSEEPMVGLVDLVEGAAYFYLGDVEAAIKSYRSCLKRRYPSKDEYDQHVSAFALYELGSSLCNNNNLNEGKGFLLKAQNQYRDYDFESRLNVRIHSALRNVQ
ncbi:tetratricopeptide repeat protein 39C isoform X4 [Ooceraea biroi]|uniref:tetratricopeptide repeat protein 39C isoform X4 n=1 Tax=Ooceraea biroi TaxID=2015173 RepID=UPI0005B9B56C|nr:tetratricopeptide repeat protein 39C isoform X4 [Ooceraea biroi]